MRLTDAFSTWERYQETFHSTEDKKRAFVSKLLPGAEVEACTFLCQLLAGNSAIHEIVLAAVNEIFLMPAEMIFARPAWAKDEIIDLDCLLQPDEEKVEAPLQAAAEEATEQAIAPQPAPASESGAAAQLQEEYPDQATGHGVEVESQPERRRSEYFSMLQCPQWLEDMFKKISLTSFEAALAHSQQCFLAALASMSFSSLQGLCGLIVHLSCSCPACWHE